MRPRINTTKTAPVSQYGSEVYTIKGHREIFFYKRVEAILRTKEVAIQKRTTITMLLNGVEFAIFNKYGNYTYVYDPSKDKESSPELKQLFISKGIAVN
jgi:hypothetical protein